MKINFFKYLIFFLILILSAIIYLSTFGIETKKFNKQIKDKVVQSNRDLNIDLKKVKLTLDPLMFRVNAKTIGATIYYLNRPIELEYIKTKISLDSFFKNKIVSSNFEIVSKSAPPHKGHFPIGCISRLSFLYPKIFIISCHF